MAESTGHCPYLGLRQNRAIRFASPTIEHRCYISGEPLDIPVDQASYCLAQGHVHCPLYMGLTIPTTPTLTPQPNVAGTAAAGGLRGWFAMLSPRDRTIYALMLAILAIIIVIYLLVGLQSLLNDPGSGSAPTSVASAPPAPTATAPTSAAPATPSSAPPTPTDLPTSTPRPTATEEPTKAPIILQPTLVPSLPPTAVPAPPTQAPAATAAPRPTSQPKPTQAAAATARPTQAPTATATPAVALDVQPVTLYFADASGSVLVPVQRNTQVADKRIAEAALKELIAGPRNGLGRLVNAEARLLGISIDAGRATANFDRDPGGIDSIVFTLTEFSTVSSVQVQVNGANLGGARARPVLNPINPQNLPVDVSRTEFLPLYFPAAGSNHDIRFIRMVPKTKQVAEATVRALLEGPGSYAGVARRVIPEGVQLRGIKLEQGVILVDFTQPFAEARELDAAMRTIVESLTTLKTVDGVQFLVEGRAFADGRIFRRGAINQE